MTRITKVSTWDVRFPTSRDLSGSDAMHGDPDYSAAYVVLQTDDRSLEGHGLAFTIGRGNELCVAAIDALTPLVLGWSMDEITLDMAGFWRRLTSDSQLRWVGPEKGVIHLATAAIVNAHRFIVDSRDRDNEITLYFDGRATPGVMEGEGTRGTGNQQSKFRWRATRLGDLPVKGGAKK